MRRRPLFWFVVAFTGGVLLADRFAAAPLFFASGFIACLLLWKITRRERWFQAAIVLLALALGGFRCHEARIMASADAARLAPAFGKITGTIASEVDLRGAQSEDAKPRAAFTLAAQTLEIGPRIFSVCGFMQVSLPLNAAVPIENIPRYGETVALTGRFDLPEDLRNPGGFDYRANLTRKGIYTALAVRRPEDWRIVSEAGGAPLLRFALALRSRILRHSRSILPPESAAVLNGILLGSRSELPPDLRDAFERTGTAHVLATAGLHIGIFAGLLFSLLRLCSMGRKPATFSCLIALALFAVMAGGRPSVMRAALVAGLFLAGFLLEREPDWWNITAFAALILLLQSPLLLFDEGFQLSFVTVITLVLMMPLFAPFLKKFRPDFRDSLPVRLRKLILEYFAVCFAVSAAAQFAVAPLLAYYSHEISPISIFANATVVPLVAPIFALGFGSFTLGLLRPAFALLLVPPLHFLLNLLIELVRWWDGLPFSAFNLPSPPVWFLWVWYGSLWLLLWRLQAGRPRTKKREAVE